MRIDIVTIFPEYFTPLDLSLIGRARAGELLDLAVHDLRRWTHDVHRTVDDTPYGGGPGMVMRPEPWGEALDALCPRPCPSRDAGPGGDAGSGGGSGEGGPGGTTAGPAEGVQPAVGSGESDGAPEPGAGCESGGGGETGAGCESGGGAETGGGCERGGGGDTGGDPSWPGAGVPRLVVPTPAGPRFSQAMAAELASESHLIFACGRYEGIDQRVLEHAATRMRVTEVSLGDYVLFGGEVAVLAMLEAVIRLLPGVLGNAESLTEESHANGLLEAPVYTKPPVWRGLAVPDVLRSGDHGRIARWRRDRALVRTARQRPDLLLALAPQSLDKRDVAVLAEAGFQVPGSHMAK